MTDATIAVLALDAADYALARRWECEHLLLAEHAPLETFSYSLDHPFTPEVWTTVATGEHPETHGVVGDAQEWDSSLLRVASRLTSRFPSHVRWALGRPFRLVGAGQTFDRTALDHPFDRVRHWPGITPAHHLDDMWTWIELGKTGRLDEATFHERLRRYTGEEFGWLASAATGTDGVACAGVHSHVLDAAGHVYAERPEELRDVYEWVDEQVRWLRGAVDELVVLSDHGMQTTAVDDPDPGVHSDRALVAATTGVETPLPRSVFDVRAWLDGVTADGDGDGIADEPGSGDPLTVDATREQLADLGYLEVDR